MPRRLEHLQPREPTDVGAVDLAARDVTREDAHAAAVFRLLAEHARTDRRTIAGLDLLACKTVTAECHGWPPSVQTNSCLRIALRRSPGQINVPAWRRNRAALPGKLSSGVA